MKRLALLFFGAVILGGISMLRISQGANLFFANDESMFDRPLAQPPPPTAVIQIGQEYSARTCYLDPAWGTVGMNSSCVGRSPPMANTTAGHLTCDQDSDKPTFTDRSKPGITIALLYFAKPALLFRQLEEFATYPTEIRSSLTVLIIDDGSPPGLRVSDYLNVSSYESPFRLRLARIVTERDWNIGGARNLAFYLVDTPKALLLDLDILVPRSAMEAAITWPLWDDQDGQRKQLAHRFNRRRVDGSENKHPAVCIIRTEAYWENGGCDEDFCGSYGFTDVHFWFRWKADPARAMVDHLDTYLEELAMMACDPVRLGAKEEACKEARSKLEKPGRNLKKNHGLYKTKTKDGCWSNKYLRFRWILEY